MENIWFLCIQICIAGGLSCVPILNVNLSEKIEVSFSHAIVCQRRFWSYVGFYADFDLIPVKI